MVQLRVSMSFYEGVGGTQIANAINYATETFNTERPISILNFSGGSANEHAGVRQAILDYPGLFVTAADNVDLNHDTSLDYPTNYSRELAFVNGRNNVISVSSLNSVGSRPSGTAWGSTSVSIFAPGQDILTTHRSSNTAYTRSSRTSFATPHVTGVAALMMSANPTLTPNDIKTTILNNATWVNITHPSGFLNLGSTTISVRRLNAEEAVAAVSQFKTRDLSETTIEISGVTRTLTGNVTMPERLSGRTVTQIGNSAFTNQTSLAQILLPASVTSIGSSAFKNCTGLTNITLPNNLTSIGAYAFEGCINLNEMYIPSSVTNISKDAFNKTNNLPIYITGRTSVPSTFDANWNSSGNPVYLNGSLCTHKSGSTVVKINDALHGYLCNKCRTITSKVGHTASGPYVPFESSFGMFRHIASCICGTIIVPCIGFAPPGEQAYCIYCDQPIDNLVNREYYELDDIINYLEEHTHICCDH